MIVELQNENGKERLDVAVSLLYQVTRSRASNLIKESHVSVNGRIETKSGFQVADGDELEVQIPEIKETELIAQDIPLRIIYQDEDLAVVYKPSGMVVHPAAGNPDNTMVNALLYQLPDLSGIGGEIRPGIVHRIDKDTSGLLLVAKNDRSHLSLSEQIKEHSVERAYRAIVIGSLKDECGSVEGDIGRSPKDRQKMAIVRTGGRYAHTDWKKLEELKGATYIECKLTTGRTHQIRVHMASLGHPVLGDPLYGPKKSPYPVEGGQLLHAYKIGFVHPGTGKKMLFEEEPEPRFNEWLNRLRQ